MGTALKLCFYSIALYLSGVFAIFAPLPLLYLYCKKGRTPFYLAIAAAVLFLFVFYSVVLRSSYDIFLPQLFGYAARSEWGLASYGAVYYLAYAAIATLLGLAGEKDWSMRTVFARFAVAFFGFVALFSLLVYAFEGHSVLALIREEFHAVFAQLVELERERGTNSVEFDLLLAKKDSIVHSLSRVFVGIAFVWAWLVSLVNLGLARRLFTALPIFSKLKPFAEWRLPFYTVWLSIAAVAFLLLHLYWIKLDIGVDVASNLLVVLGVLYVVQGLSVVSFFIQKWTGGGLARLAIYAAIVIFFQVVGLILLAVGFFDMWIDSRRLEKENSHGSDLK